MTKVYLVNVFYAFRQPVCCGLCSRAARYSHAVIPLSAHADDKKMAAM